MLEVPNTKIMSPPPILISQIPDPDFFPRMCQPFIGNNEKITSFSLAFVINNLIPSIKQQISKLNFEAIDELPKLTRIFIDNLDQDGLNLVTNEILPALHDAFQFNNSAFAVKKLTKLISSTICSIPSRYRDDVLFDIIAKDSSGNEAQIRSLAATLSQYVLHCDKITSYCRALLLDRVPQVRIDFLKALPNSNFSLDFIEYVVRSSIKDRNPKIRRETATIISQMCPDRYDLYQVLFYDPETAKSAFRNIKPIVKANGFQTVLADFREGMKYEAESSAAALINLSRVVNESEHDLLLNCCLDVRFSPIFVQHLHKFSLVFSNKNFFLHFLDPRGAPNWRIKISLLQQAILFVDTLHSKLCDIAIYFSEDLVAAVRNYSVDLWESLIDDDKTNAIEAKKLMQDNWQIRLVLAKIIAKCNFPESLNEEFLKLCNDNVSNIRFFLAQCIMNDREMFEKCFGKTEDKDIAALINNQYE
ncbi:hypothetical protein GPJ56_006514 [Histomonas meleagridis]|uniref:uncharacterized protein n=1 Tax=Histomonas meleagridis TaxID=135588 RepID=UPI00355A8411|nr:hypothetical protein GPJ56_006514 [Histomonas meleagridis]KAH0801751.1 hypothetical protein GO595_005432 [Histomonas meleagridis]